MNATLRPRRCSTGAILLLMLFFTSALMPLTSATSDEASSEGTSSNADDDASDDASNDGSEAEVTRVTPVVDVNCTARPAIERDWLYRGDSRPVQASQEARPDMPWGDVVSRVECWLHNPHPYTITVAVLSTEDAELFDPALEICTSIWDWSCTTGHWDPAYTLSSSENISVEWIVYAEARASVAPAGEAIVEFGLKITNYGTNRTACPECTVRFVNTTLQLGEWWRVDWDGSISRNNSLCPDNPYRTWNSWDCYPITGLSLENTWTGEFTPAPWIACTTYHPYGFMWVRYSSIPTQEVTVCEPSFNEDFAELFSEDPLTQARRLADPANIEDNMWQWQRYGYDEITELPEDYWSSQRCPDEPFEAVVLPSIVGNHVPDVRWDVEIRAHHYAFDDDEWTVSTVMERSYNISNATMFDANESLFLLDLSNLDDGELLWLDWVVFESGQKVGSGILGECLTTGGVDYLDDLFLQAEVTMGEAGMPFQRLFNKIAFSMGIPIYVVVAAVACMIFGVARLVDRIKR